MQEQKPKPQPVSRHKFTAEEDEKLRELVRELGENDWGEVSSRLGTRSPRQCRERFKNYLAPNLRNDPWTKEEERLLIAKQKEFGTRWSVIASFFPERSDVNIKNHWTQMMNRTSRERDLEHEKQEIMRDLDSVIHGAQYGRESTFIEDVGIDWGQDDPGSLYMLDQFCF